MSIKSEKETQMTKQKRQEIIDLVEHAAVLYSMFEENLFSDKPYEHFKESYERTIREIEGLI